MKKNFTEVVRDGFLKILRVNIDHEGIPRKQWECMERGDSVTILTKITNTNTIVLLKQFRVGEFLREGSLKSFSNPAGMIDKGENPMQAAIRELDEETGCGVPDSIHYLGKGYPSSGGSTEVSHMFFAEVSNPVLKPKDKSEGITIEKIDLDIYEKHMQLGRFKSLQMQTTYLLAKSKGLI